MPQESVRVSEASPFKTSAEILKNFSWNLPPFFLTEEVRESGARYLEDLQGEKYGRTLSELEETYEWSLWLRSQAMAPNLNSFNQLCTLCLNFFDELSKIGKQSILGTRAGLKKAQIHELPSSQIEFKPEPLPDQPPLSGSEYESHLGGPHVFGSRLLWWCAAVKSSEKFGYPPGFSQKVWTQPFWFTEKGNDELRPNPRPIILLGESVTYCIENYADSESPSKESSEKTNSASAQKIQDRLILRGPELPPECGPGPAGRFYWNGEPIELQPLQAHLMELLWTQKPNTQFSAEDVAEKVWGRDNVTDDNFWSCVSKLNKRFNEAHFPIEIFYQRGHFYFLIHK